VRKGNGGTGAVESPQFGLNVNLASGTALHQITEVRLQHRQNVARNLFDRRLFLREQGRTSIADGRETPVRHWLATTHSCSGELAAIDADRPKWT